MPIVHENPVYWVVSLIPEGKVMTYGQIATLVPGQTARMVARALKHTPDDTMLPWHRVVSAHLKIADFPGNEEQIMRLKSEGISFSGQRKITASHHWIPE